MHFRGRALTFAFSLWRLGTKEAVQNALKLTAALQTWSNSCAARALSAWAAAVRELSWKRSALLKAGLMWHHCHLSTAFQGWRSHALEAAHHRDLVQPITCALSVPHTRDPFLSHLEHLSLPSRADLEALLQQHPGSGIKPALLMHHMKESSACRRRLACIGGW